MNKGPHYTITTQLGWILCHLLGQQDKPRTLDKVLVKKIPCTWLKFPFTIVVKCMYMIEFMSFVFHTIYDFESVIVEF